MNRNGALQRRKAFLKNVVKRGKGVIFAQVIENDIENKF